MLIYLAGLGIAWAILYYVGQKVESKPAKITLRVIGYILLVLVLILFYIDWIM